MNPILSLNCPISLQRFIEPIVTPCCGQTFSRSSLTTAYQQDIRCPLCRHDFQLYSFNPNTAPINVTVADLLLEDEKKNNLEHPIIITPDPVRPIWEAKEEIVYDDLNQPVGESRRTISVQNSTFLLQPNLFVLVADHSGSMANRPWQQVEQGIVHIVSLARLSTIVQLGIIVYSSNAGIVNNPYEITSTNLTPLEVDSGGGTNFVAAFDTTFKFLTNKVVDNKMSYNEITIAFLTDGLSNTVNDRLITNIRSSVQQWKGPAITIHSIGFSASCDRNFLEEIRKSGHNEGMFRYADESDDIDILSQKLTSIFDPSLKSVKTKILINGEEKYFQVDEKNYGTLINWIGESKEEKKDCVCLKVQTDGEEIKIPISFYSFTPETEDHKNLFLEWFRKCLDDVARHLVLLAQTQPCQQTKANILKQQLNNMLKTVYRAKFSNQIAEQLKFLTNQLEQLINGGKVELLRIYDLRFASQFALQEKKQIQKIISTRVQQPLTIYETKNNLLVQETNSKIEKPLHHYSRNSVEKELYQRNDLHQAILNTLSTQCNFVYEQDEKLISDFLIQQDKDQNNALHFAAYCGQYHTMKRLCEIALKYKLMDRLDVENKHGETPVTLAIKKRGFFRTMQILLRAGGVIPLDRIESLQQYCISQGYLRTAENLISFVPETTLKPSKNMNLKYLKFLWKNKSDESATEFFKPVLSKGADGYELLEEIVTSMDEKKEEILFTEQDLLEYGFPLKPDAKDTETYLKITKMLLKNGVQLTGASLFRAVEKGSLPHVQFILDSDPKMDMEWRNELGNTSLWLACAKRYPCIIEELLKRGADPNAENTKKNPPLSAVCQMGNIKIAQLLLTFGVKVEYENENGDTSIILCCRNNQHEVLKLLLQYATSSFITHKAHVDGFDVVLAATEANNPQCIQVLYESGMNLNVWTDEKNEILSFASPLHLAAYYNRLQVGEKLLELKMDPNLVMLKENFTPLQIATIQDNFSFVQLLLRYKAKKDGALLLARGEIEKLLTETFELTDEKSIEEVWHSYWNNIDEMKDVDDNTFLIKSILEGDLKRATLCLKLKASCDVKNRFGMSAQDYACWIGQPRLTQLVGTNSKVQNQVRGIARQVTFYSPHKWIPLQDFFLNRMIQIIETKEEDKIILCEKFLESKEFQQIKNENPELLSYATYLTIGTNDSFVKKFIQNLYLISSGSTLIPTKYLLSAIEDLPFFHEEVFALLPRRIAINETLNISNCFSASALWRLASRCDSSSKEMLDIGIFNLKTKARFLGGKHSEVILLPGQYKATKWYHYSPICLGQKSIREKTFKIKPQDVIKRIIILFDEI